MDQIKGCPHSIVCPHLSFLSPPIISVPTCHVCPHLFCLSQPIMSVPNHNFFADRSFLNLECGTSSQACSSCKQSKSKHYHLKHILRLDLTTSLSIFQPRRDPITCGIKNKMRLRLFVLRCRCLYINSEYFTCL